MTDSETRRGRPRSRSDEETRHLIFEAARHVFASSGYNGASMDAIARGAGVSTKTLYRLLPTKAALFEQMVSDRLDRLAEAFSLGSVEDSDIEASLVRALTVCAELTFDPEVVAMQRVVLQDPNQSRELAATFFRNGIERTTTALSVWLEVQRGRGNIDIVDPDVAAGMLIGMLASAPQRAHVFGGVPLPTKATVAKRVKTCARIFLFGCAGIATRPMKTTKK